MNNMLDIFSTTGTFLAVIAALAIAIWGDRFKSWGGYKSNIKVIDKLESIQESENKVKRGQTRLVFYNNG